MPPLPNQAGRPPPGEEGRGVGEGGLLGVGKKVVGSPAGGAAAGGGAGGPLVGFVFGWKEGRRGGMFACVCVFPPSLPPSVFVCGRGRVAHSSLPPSLPPSLLSFVPQVEFKQAKDYVTTIKKRFANEPHQATYKAREGGREGGRKG